MQLSPQLAARFETLQNRYPVKRSALIPMLMYAQDEYGCVSDEMIAEIAPRLDLNTVQVEETLAYYSMLHRKPMGKHHVQICTNVACMLRGGNEILERAKKRLEIGHKEVTAGRHFFARRSRVHRRLHRRAGHAGQLRLLRKSHGAQVRPHHRGTRRRQSPDARAGHLRGAARARIRAKRR